ncbi:carbohydrate kinase [Nocardioides marmoriginsengisoli]|uniref:Carbohydrate kinase n=1 Tax=Nocardioides marmoriginsengisoli TaxID=661483 RepID=A0A3N0CD18_9ACTN|nr:carbohydrate kinase [Nocardioides marmoriginsengisoli]RNL61335.1 carbohydrate kinase [Nocardioides marmoriginsengisoli]
MIVVVGESLVDLSSTADGAAAETVGGSPLNVAVALARLETPTLLITEIGADERAATVVRHLQESEVEYVAVPTADGRTPTATVLVDDGDPIFTVDLTWNLPHEELPHCDALHVGSLGTVLEPGRDSVLDLVEQAWALDVFVSYDPNVRAGHLTEHDHDQAWGDIESLADRANLVKLSEQDIELLHPGADPDDIARSLLTGDRTELVILTRGADGATAFTASSEVSVGGIVVEVADTVGAGDAFMAAVLTVLLESDSLGNYGPGLPRDDERLTALLGAAVEAAGLSCARPGAAAPLRSELSPGWPGSAPS